MTTRDEGIHGEDAAVQTLKKEGYRILERNHRNKLGEIDIVAEEKKCLVFVEVKKRNTSSFGEAVYAVDKRKKRHLVKAAMMYMKINRCFDRQARFDVIAIDGEQIKLIRNAFLVDEIR